MGQCSRIHIIAGLLTAFLNVYTVSWQKKHVITVSNGMKHGSEYYIKTVWRDIIVIVRGYYSLIISSHLINPFSWGLVWFKICLLPRPFFFFFFLFLRSVWSFHFNFFLHQAQYPNSLIYPLRTIIWILGLAAFYQLWIIRGWVLISSSFSLFVPLILLF